ncbi:MAG: hypothetical protein ACRC8S_22460 [Fimbriiglobus sp.]
MKKLFLALAAAVALMSGVNVASANGCPGGPFCQQPGPRIPFFRNTPVPAFQAAPWYMYFPYNGHFQTPAPVYGAFYAPPMGGAGMMNPYFPAPQQMPGR